MTPIDWQMLARGQTFYEERGYRNVDVPWVVQPEVAAMTFPDEGLTCQLGSLVGSGEQGFLASKRVVGAKLMTITPCFRDEPKISDTNRYWFMKLELYRESFDGDYSDFVSDALDLFDELGIGAETIETNEGHDIVDAHGMELGSYGFREVDGRSWAYGTGLALPRASIALKNRVAIQKVLNTA